MTATDPDRTRTAAAVRDLIARREDLFERLESGQTDLATVLGPELGDPTVAATYVLPVLESTPGWGKVSSRRLLDGLGIEHTCPLGALSEADRTRLIEARP